MLLSLLLVLPFIGNTQESSLRERTFTATDTLKLDTLSIYPNSFELKCDGVLLSREYYKLDFAAAQLTLQTNCGGKLTAKYRVLPMDLSKVYAVRDTSVIYNQKKGNRDKFLITSNYSQTDIFGGDGLNKSGSISRGVSFGNKQDLGINSSLNLELSGQIAPNLKLLASVSDDNLPIQPDGNTNKLQEFDQVFIQVYNDRFSMTAGDFWLYKPEGYFMSYKKRAQGLTIKHSWLTDTTRSLKTEFSGAFSKGKFRRQLIQGVEGNQGPYRLTGVENEPFIIVLSGTERVYIDGVLLERGQEHDYVIDYNTSEVTFTSRNQITKDRRIVVEFQYSDQNYARSLLQTSTVFQNKKVKFWFNAYTEQDAKNQPIQQDLTISQKKMLSEIGDTLNLGRISSLDSVGYLENQNLYALVDSLTYDSVLVYSVNPDSAYYRATFEFVGAGNGDYIFKNYNALGKVYQWVVPILGVSQGDYAPSRLIITPKKRQMVSAGLQLKLTKRLTLETELAYTKNDVNTFSRFDAKDDQSFSGRTKLIGNIPLLKDSTNRWTLRTKLEVEGLEKSFVPIEQYRSVEFDRDWNTRNQGYDGNQLATSVGANFIHHKNGNLNFEGQQFLIGTDYLGLRSTVNGKWNGKGLRAIWNGSFLSSESTSKNEFLRHKVDVSQALGKIRIGFKDEQELNTFRTDVLSPSSYEFFAYEFYLSNSDSVKNEYRVFYREREDGRSDSTILTSVATARTVGGEARLKTWKNQKLGIVTSYRELVIQDTMLINIAPENTLLGRVDYELRALKGGLTVNLFYEAGSGLELKREFLYIQVNDGQGVYTWIDYNSDGVKDLNEFEIAQFIDEASYIRVFTPSNEYVKTYSNEFNQSIYWRPERIWSNKKGFLKMMTRFSDHARFRVNRKTNYFDGNEAYNPFATSIRDSNLISTNTNIRNTLYFNRTSSLFGAEYSFQDVSSKSLLASGFDSRRNEFHELSLRINIRKKITVKLSGKKGSKASEADYTAGRNYDLGYYFIEPSFIYQPNTVFRISIDGRISEKTNAENLGGEVASVVEIGSTFKYNQREKGSFQGSFKMIEIDYTGIQNSALGFEMLEALKPGVNYTWNLGYQHSISKTLQLSFQYNGRKSKDNTAIHSGGMEIRAFF